MKKIIFFFAAMIFFSVALAQPFVDATLMGKIRYSDDTPAEDIEVMAFDEEYMFMTTFTDELGEFEFIWSGGANIHISTFSGPGDIIEPPSYDITVEDGEIRTGLNFVIIIPTLDATISGAVCFEDSAPAPGIEVSAYGFGYYSTITDAEGNYFIDVFGGDSYELYCYADMYISEPVFYAVSPDSGDSLTGYDFVLIDPYSTDALIRGRITHDDSTAAPSISIEAYMETEPYFGYSGYSDAEGYYEIAVRGGYTYRVEAWEPMIEPEFYSIFAAVGDTIDSIDFVIPASPEIDAWFMGGIIHSDGSPASGIDIISYADYYSYFTTTDAEGKYTLAVAGGYNYYILCDSWEYMPDPPEYERYITSGDTIYGINFVLTPYADDFELIVFVRDSAGMGISGALIECIGDGPGTPYAEGITDGFGYAYFSFMEPAFLTVIPTLDGTSFTPIDTFVSVDDPFENTFVEFVASGADVFESSTIKPEQLRLDIHPNPFNSGVRLQVSGVREQEVGFEIFDLRGNSVVGAGLALPYGVLESKKGTASHALKSCTYIWQPDESIASGIYLVRARTDDGYCITKRIVYVR